ncbi:hypothetical protein LSH36_153g01018 [Paralvinella palmiformis]|uniref:Uncharacterized protein n=1 Tax=Paralvinella palmiformis TaxID=53620 RepID=A0AAD9JUA9_9ANNE|nr:hypothetical protein LSH36_153g01018 [Paralvinella palmiformis]
MPSSVLLRSCLALLIVYLLFVDGSRGILTQYRGKLRKAPANQHVYKYLRGYYQNGKSAQASPPRRSFPHVPRSAIAENAKKHSPANAKSFGTTYIQPKSGLQSGRYRFAQSPDYVQKLKRLAALLKARAAARSRRKSPVRSYVAAQPHPQRGYQQQQPAQRSAPAQYVPKQSYSAPIQLPAQYPAPAPPQPSYGAPQPAPPQPSYGVQQSAPPQPSYGVQQSAPPQPSYGVQQSAPAQPSYGVQQSAPSQSSYGQINQRPGFQSLGLPRGQTYQAVQQPLLPVPLTTPRPSSKVSSQALVRLLKASYASLLPLLLNQVKMTSYGVQSIPLYGSNPYSVFGPMTYGPLPKPNLSQMSLSYNPQSFSTSQTRPLPSPVSGYTSNNVVPQQTGYNTGVNTGYGTGSQSVSSGGYGSSQTFDISADDTCGPVSGTYSKKSDYSRYDFYSLRLLLRVTIN